MKPTPRPILNALERAKRRDVERARFNRQRRDPRVSMVRPKSPNCHACGMGGYRPLAPGEKGICLGLLYDHGENSWHLPCWDVVMKRSRPTGWPSPSRARVLPITGSARLPDAGRDQTDQRRNRAECD